MVGSPASTLEVRSCSNAYSKYPCVLARHREGPLAEAREQFLVHCANEGMAPGTLLRIARTVATSAKALRAFFRYAEQRGWCAVGIAAGIVGPRVFTREGVPVGPDWNDVRRLIDNGRGNTRRDIRDAAILQLFAVYGFRSAEVAKLRLDDVQWAQDRICLWRPKQRCAQEYPLLPSVGDAILRCVQQVRPRSACREMFLRLRAPFRPLSAGGLYDMVRQRLDALRIRSLRRGPTRCDTMSRSGLCRAMWIAIYVEPEIAGHSA